MISAEACSRFTIAEDSMTCSNKSVMYRSITLQRTGLSRDVVLYVSSAWCSTVPLHQIYCHHLSIPHFLHPLRHSVRVTAHLLLKPPTPSQHLVPVSHSLHASLFLSTFLTSSLFLVLSLSIFSSWLNLH